MAGNPDRDHSEAAWQNAETPPMFPRDEVIRAIERRGDCRMPQAFTPVPLFFRNESLYDFFEKWPSDFEYVNLDLDPRRFFEMMTKDQLVLHGSSAVNHLLKDWSQVDDVLGKLFGPLTQEWKDSVRARVDATPGRYHVALHVALFFELMYILRGMEQFFIDLYESRAQVEALLDRIFEYTCEMMRGYGEAGVDGIFIGDDWGSQRSLLIQPDLWREIFKPRYAKWTEVCHEAGMHVLFHSDGNLDAVFPDLVETGMDVFNPLQPNAIDADRWRKEYKGQLTFWTGVDVQGVLPFATPQKVRDEIHRSVENFSDDCGGFILGPTNAITAEVPYENLVAVYETLLEYR